jgi:hypothetical protein
LTPRARTDDFGLTELLAPVTLEEFLSEYREKRMCHVSGRGPEYYSGVFSLSDVDAVLPPGETRAIPQARAVNRLKAKPGTEAAGLHEEFLDGATVNINNVDWRSRPLNHLCRKMERVFHAHAGANVYLTPRKSQGFAAHFDDHDVFVMQISGDKRWEIWPSDSLPLRASGAARPKEIPPGGAESIVLKPGDMLYLPRGFVHQAFAEEQVTLHITIGVDPFRWLDLALSTMRFSAERTRSLREALPAGFIGNPEMPGLARERLEGIIGPIAEDGDIRKGLSELGRQFIAKLTPVIDNRFEILAAIQGLDQNSVMGKREGSVAVLEVVGGSVNLYFRGGTMSGPASIQRALKFIVAKEMFRIEEIPGLDASSKIVVAARLVTEGYLTVLSSE